MTSENSEPYTYTSMKYRILNEISAALASLGIETPAFVEVETPRDASMGDYSTPVGMVLARTLKRPPRQIAQSIADAIPKGGLFKDVTVAGPGFINFTLSDATLADVTRTILTSGTEAMLPSLGKGRRIQIEFVSANPTGPLHLGHGRGAAVGCALSNILTAGGYEVVREYYVNDAGRQVKLLGESVFARYKELLGVDYPFPEDGYKGDYIIEAGRRMLEQIGEKYRDAPYDTGAEAEFIQSSLDAMLDVIKEDLDHFGVRFDVWQSERTLYSEGAVGHAIEFLRDKGLMYEADGALWFRATEFGDEKDRVTIKADGAHTYFASDIAYHLKKVEAGFDEIIDIWGADHHGYIPRMEAVIEALGYDRARLKVLLIQMVNLLRGGKPVQMSKRSGEFVTLREVIDEVGADITKFVFLTRRHDSQLTFDLESVKAASAENPVFYIQYANARINSLFAHAATDEPEAAEINADLALLVEPEERRLMAKLAEYPMVFELASEGREPHRITFYLQELAGTFHPYYNRHRVVTGTPALTSARLALCDAVRRTIRDGLKLIGISAPDKM